MKQSLQHTDRTRGGGERERENRRARKRFRFQTSLRTSIRTSIDLALGLRAEALFQRLSQNFHSMYSSMNIAIIPHPFGIFIKTIFGISKLNANCISFEGHWFQCHHILSIIFLLGHSMSIKLWIISCSNPKWPTNDRTPFISSNLLHHHTNLASTPLSLTNRPLSLCSPPLSIKYPSTTTSS